MEPRSPLRPLLAVVLATAWVVVAWFGLLLSELAAPSLGWLPAAAVFAVGLAVAGLVWGGDHRSVVLAVLAVVAVGLGVAIWVQSPPSLDRVRDLADDVSMPDGWERTDRRSDDRSVGIGPTQWQVVSTYYTDETSYSASAEELSATLEAQGWQEVELSRQGDGAFAVSRDGWSLLVTRGGGGESPVVNVAVVSGPPAY